MHWGTLAVGGVSAFVALLSFVTTLQNRALLAEAKLEIANLRVEMANARATVAEDVAKGYMRTDTCRLIREELRRDVDAMREDLAKRMDRIQQQQLVQQRQQLNIREAT